MNAKNILALDIASATGWAVSTKSGDIEEVKSGTHIVTSSGDEHEGARYVRWQQWVRGLLALHKPEVVYYEEVEFAGPGMLQLRIYSSYRAMLLAACSTLGIRCEPVPVSKNKLLATDNGGAKKPEMIVAARVFFPDQLVKDDNQADALHLLRWGKFAEVGAIHATLAACRARSKANSKARAKVKAAAKKADGKGAAK